MNDIERAGVNELVNKLNIKEERIVDLEKENAELKDYGSEGLQAYLKLEKQLTEAKDLIRNLLRVTYGEGWNYSLQVKVEAEKFLKECE